MRSFICIFRREIRSLVLSPIAYIVGGVFLLTSGWFFFSSFFLVDRADLRNFFTLLPFVLSFAVPAVTMRLFSEEYRSGSFELLKTLPVNAWEIVLGKFASAFAFMKWVIFATLPYPIFVSLLGDLDWGPVLGGYFGAILLASVYCAIGLLFSSYTRNQVVAFIVSSAICFFLSFIDTMLLLVPKWIAGVLQHVGTGFHFRSFSRGVFDSRDAIYFIALSFVALFATVMRISGKERSEMKRFFLYTTATVLVYVASLSLFARFDLTKRHLFSLSSASKTAVNSLEEPLNVKIFLSDNLPQPYNNLKRDLSDLMEEYSLYGNRNFNYTIFPISSKEGVDGTTSLENATKARRYGIHPVQIQDVAADEVKLVSAYMGIAITHGDAEETIPVISPQVNLEYTISTAINKINRKTSAFLRLDEKVDVILFLSSSLSDLSKEFVSYSDELEKVVEELNKKNYGKLSFSHVDPDSLAPGMVAPSDLNVEAISLRTKAGGVKNYYATVAVRLGEKAPSHLRVLRQGLFGYSIASAEELTESLSHTIEREVGIGIRVGYLSDHGTVPLYGSPQREQKADVRPQITSFRSLVDRDYSLQSVTLDEGIPADLRTLIVAGPQEAFNDWDLYQLDQFVMRGNSLIILYDAFREFNPQASMPGIPGGGGAPLYVPNELGLDPFFEHFGVQVLPSYLMDKKSYVQQRRTQDGGIAEIPIYFAPIVQQKAIDKNAPIMENIKQLILLKVSPLKILESKEGRPDLTVLFSSSDEAWEISENVNLQNPYAIYPPVKEKMQRYPLAVLAEGELVSYFEGKSVPVRPIKDADRSSSHEKEDEAVVFSSHQASFTENPLSSTSEGKVFLFPSSYLFSDSTLDEQGTSPNGAFVLNLIDVLSGRGDFASMRSKGQSFNPLLIKSGLFASFIKWFNIFGLPLLIGVVGLVVWFRWLGRQRQIEASFGKRSQQQGGA